MGGFVRLQTEALAPQARPVRGFYVPCSTSSDGERGRGIDGSLCSSACLELSDRHPLETPLKLQFMTLFASRFPSGAGLDAKK